MKRIIPILALATAASCTSWPGSDYGNIAERHAAYHSSSSDYNLTAQLATDGIIATERPATLSMSTHQGVVPVTDREKLLDDNDVSKLSYDGQDIYVQLDYDNMVPDADMMTLKGMVYLDATAPKGYEIVTTASVDGTEWVELDRQTGAGDIGKAVEMRGWGGQRRPQATNDNPSPVKFLYDYTPAPKDEPEQRRPWDGNRNVTARVIDYSVPVDTAARYSHYRIALKAPAAQRWELSTWDFAKNGESIYVLPSTQFTSAWRSATGADEWLYVDLGDQARFDKVVLYWLNKAKKGEIQVSDDAAAWRTVARLPEGDALTDTILLGSPVRGRYVKLALTESADGNPYELSEMQVWGSGAADLTANAAKHSAPDNVGYGRWRLQRASQVEGDASQIATVGYDDAAWVPATVPGTVLKSFINIGAVPDPNFADNQLQISESYFMDDFWYRTEFESPVSSVQSPESREQGPVADALSMLEFDGVNWKADVYVNGQHVGDIDGAFKRGKFDVTDLLVPGTNALAVKIHRNAHPGAVKEQTAYTADGNGGALGADNPTFHASIGWDWIPTIRGRNIGLWNDVRLTSNGGVTIEDPFVQSRLSLPDTTKAYITVEATLKNRTDKPVKGELRGTIGDLAFSKPVELAANSDEVVIEILTMDNPRLWWPKGYGEPYLYDVDLAFVADGKTTDSRAFKTGIRQVDWDESPYLPSGGQFYSSFGDITPTRLSLYINGRRFVGFGGNWGFSESNLDYSDSDYDTAVGYHADQNFTMIRNWVGQIGDEEFYEACDRHGVMVWQDFWLANPYDGPDPLYNDMFEDNARDWVRRIRNHPSIALYCGRNEGNPPTVLDDYLRQMVLDEHPGMHYISHSAAGVVSGGGPYRALPPKQYYNLHGHDKMHSERGMPCVMNYEHLVQALGADRVDSLNTVDTPSDIYGLHDYTLNSAQSASTFNDMITKAFGTPKDAKQFTEWAQWINYNGYRAIFEARSEHRRGMLLWMSHPAWPSMVWQTYDYYFEPTAAYFGCKKACETLHIQWNPLRDDIEVVNYHAGDHQGLTATAQLINQDGKVQWEHSAPLDIVEDQTVAVFPLEQPQSLTDTYFIKLALTDADGRVVSDNFYWRGLEEDNFQSLLQVPAAKVDATWTAQPVPTPDGYLDTPDGYTTMTGTVTNTSDVPALMIRLKAVDPSGEMILPAVYSDNYFFLMPGESRDITVTFPTPSASPSVTLSYMNM